MRDTLDSRLAARVAELRVARGWSLDDLAGRTGVSRSTLSRLERAEISPTASLLGRLCAAYGWTMSRLLAEVEAGAEPPALVRAADQRVWRDEASGFTRRSVSPPHAGLRGELIEGVLEPGADIAYDAPPVAGMEQHVWVLDGRLEFTDDGTPHTLDAGDCLRLRLLGSTRLRNPGTGPVRYAIFVALP
ncbi:helix-turn-helix domain-containing protein [Amorphoplanes digitatis]|uniref:Transcriptional regulator with XRE-family HTH domain n=1 Tax=Actinoplanes digitatis TaxID=1868 RepID=A0A7W7HYB6_9ACTN|nr:XRE family transcriptional regulator [Actinoplanes digitatis]MBB4763017.1 transcriptional regulator with XRE-family HTH domain [Actinoplanes digitatis]BFE71996.1 XRE family transcriptional regulator [Actinoplanes digitatis]GID95782.1 DNA-binding protein [Actinoplanes digitatis]